VNGSPLDGVQVLETASYVSGPFAAQMLVDLGAEVIKIEGPPKGDANASPMQQLVQESLVVRHSR
jgi:crotonobetainyl-CoA:carnitine CoA-transferase CaiB-like acyl-CoA transferase